jgi:heat shock protein HtpX
MICDMSGTVDSYELMELRIKTIKLRWADKIMEIYSTNPNMLKRVKHLSSLIG